MYNTSDTQGDLGNKAKVNRTCNLKTHDNLLDKPTSPRPLPNDNDAYTHYLRYNTNQVYKFS